MPRQYLQRRVFPSGTDESLTVPNVWVDSDSTCHWLPVTFTKKVIAMNPQAGVNILVMVFGLAIVALLFLLGRRILPKQHSVRRWASCVYKRNGLAETARLAGLILLAIVLSILTLLYS